MRILFIAPGDNPHTWKWVGWFGRKYPGEIGLIPYISPPPEGVLNGVEILRPCISLFKIASPSCWLEVGRIKRIVNKLRPEILHALWAYGSGTIASACNYHPFVLSPWGSDITVYPCTPGIKGVIQRDLIRGALTKADRITATSKFLGGAILKFGGEIRPPDLFPYGVDTGVFDPGVVDKPYEFNWPGRAPQGPDAVTVGFFKSLERAYGPDILITAIAKASKQLPNLRCVIGGWGRLLEILMQMAQSLNVSDRICFPRRIHFEDMPGALAGVDIFAMPSRYEVFGVGALEASAMMKPVIASRKWGIPEVVQDGVTGILVEPEDPDSLAQAIVKLAHDSDLRRKMGEEGRGFVKKNYEYENIMQQADLYCEEIRAAFHRT
jgi:glycosyltransferase involved in cell wall biosynthesis